ncbi:inner nuclear membrane protein enriched at telomere/subtelomere region [Gaertneriomyces sp. JEL0708]|nr:inner nuclear membrane protein enriched at telomere/subtelomere region [Gaertneriomyces sp. JEL0708]
MAGDVPDHLKDDFDPSKATINQLTSILSQHGVDTPGTRQKKQFYVDLFQSAVTPRRKKLIKELTKTHGKAPKAFGVVGEEYSDITGAAASLGAALPARTPSRSTRRKTLATGDVTSEPEQYVTSDSDEKTFIEPPSFSHENPFQSPSPPRPLKQKVMKKRKPTIPTTSDDNEIIRPKQSNAINAPSPQPFMFRLQQDQKFNASAPEASAADAAPETPIKASKSRVSRRKTGGDDFTNVEPQTPRRRVTSSSNDDEQPLDAAPTESLTPVRYAGMSLPGYSTETIKTPPPPATIPDSWACITPSKDLPTKTNAGRALKRRIGRGVPVRAPKSRFPWMVAFAIFLVVAVLGQWYWEFRDVLGYCDANDSSTKTTFKYSGYNPLGYVMPVCRPCPENALCVDKTVLSCDRENADYVLKPSLLATFLPHKLIPFPLDEPSCVKDTRKEQEELKRQQHVDTLLEILSQVVRYWVGAAECGSQPREVTAPLRSRETGNILGMPQTLAKQELRRKIGRRWSDTTFDTYWDLAMRRVYSSDVGSETQDVGSTLDQGTRQTRLLYSRQPPIMTFTCRLRRSLWETSRAYWLELSILGGMVMGGAFIWYKIQAKGREDHIVGKLVDDVVDAVCEEAENNRADPVRHPIPGLAVVQLKDYLLPISVGSVKRREHENSYDENTGYTKWHLRESERDKIWEKVHQMVLRNSNIRETLMDLNGEGHLIWQWIGSHALSPKKKGGAGVAAARLASGSEFPGSTKTASASDADSAPSTPVRTPLATLIGADSSAESENVVEEAT